jgi:CheY-like chemotaxis protein
MEAMNNHQHGIRVLVVEDEWIIAAYVEELLLEMGCEVIGPAPNVARAVELIQSGNPDFALLDVSLGNENSFPIAELLIKRQVPFAFVTGYSNVDLPPRYGARTMLSKPVTPEMLKSFLLEKQTGTIDS